MPFKRTPKRLLVLAALLPLPLLTSCGPDAPPATAASKPPPERVAEVPAPDIPPATTPCATDPTKLCNSDAETAGVIGGYDEALATANRKLHWLGVFLGITPK